MSLIAACQRLETSWVSTVIRQSKWGFALIEMMHLLALALFGGALLVTGLRVFGILFKARRYGAMASDLGWLLGGSFVAMILSGILLFADGPLRYYGNAAFRAKLILIAGASMTGVITYLLEVRRKPTRSAPARKALALLSGCLWLGSAIAGRVIGVL